MGKKTLFTAVILLFMFSFITEAQVTKTVNLTTAGSLATTLTAAELATVTNLTITGTIDARDFKTMRAMGQHVLASIDLNAVTISAYTGTDGTALSGTTYPANELPQYAFQSCQALKSVILPTSITSIGDFAFADCTFVSSITIPPAVTSIGSYAFTFCGFSSITIPPAVTSIGSMAFGCLAIVDGANLAFSSVDGVLFNKAQTMLLRCPTSKTGSYAIPSTVTSIGSNAFQHCSSLTSITIPSAVTSIGDYAFESCNFTSFTIPSAVTSIGRNAFWCCSSLSSIYANAATPVDLSTMADVFLYVDKSACTLYVPTGSKATYQASAQWSDFVNIVEMTTGINNQTADEPIIYGRNNTLYIENAIPNASVKVVDTSGRVRYAGKIQNTSIAIELNKGSVYLVQINSKCIKIKL